MVADIASPVVSLSYGPGGLSWSVLIDSLQVKRLTYLLMPMMPKNVRTFEWGGTIALSAEGTVDTKGGNGSQGSFLARVREGRFSSSDFQRMGEKINLDISGVVASPGDGSPVHVVLDFSLPKGELVDGGFYGDLSRTRPQFHGDLSLAPDGSAIDIKSANLVLDGVGTLHLRGTILRKDRGTSYAEIELAVIDLKGLCDHILRDGMSAMYPGFKEMSDPKSQGTRFSGSRPGHHHERSAPVLDRFLLGRC